MNRLRVALLGCGGIAGRHAGAVRALGDRMELVGCVGRDPERTAAFAREHGGEPFVDLDRMIDFYRSLPLEDALSPGALLPL